jgi:hypothetical protein
MKGKISFVPLGRKEYDSKFSNEDFEKMQKELKSREQTNRESRAHNRFGYAGRESDYNIAR